MCSEGWKDTDIVDAVKFQKRTPLSDVAKNRVPSLFQSVRCALLARWILLPELVVESETRSMRVPKHGSKNGYGAAPSVGRVGFGHGVRLVVACVYSIPPVICAAVTAEALE